MSKSKDSKVNIDKNSGGTTDPSEVEQLMVTMDLYFLFCF